MNPSAYFYHKVLHDEIGPYRQDMQIGQDLPFLLSAVQIANLKYVDELWGNWRKFEETLTIKDEKAGKKWLRKEMIMQSYLKDLPKMQQYRIVIQSEFWAWYYRQKRKLKRLMDKIV